MNINSKPLKIDNYKILLKEAKALIGSETDIIANFANIAALIKQHFNWFWIGFYIVKNQELVLGPFQGPIACTRIKYGKGVCGTAWKDEKTIIVPNVHKFPGHISCSDKSCSELVIPIFNKGKVIAVLDIDSSEFNSFNDIDKDYLEELVKLF